MEVTVRFFAQDREALGRGTRVMELPEGSSVADLLERLRAEMSNGRPPGSAVVAVDHEYAAHDRVLRGGEEIALIPPVAGG